MAVINDYRDYIRFAVESVWGTPPADAGGRYALLPVMPGSGITQITEHASAVGERQGVRSENVQLPVPGRRHSEGNLETVWRHDTGGALFYAAIGSETVAADPGGATTRKKHTIRPANVLPSITVQDFKGSQVAGVDKVYQYAGLRIGGFTVSWDATDDTGLIRTTYNNLLGKSYGDDSGDLVAYVTPNIEDIRPLPSWKATVTQESVQQTGIMTFEGTYENTLARVKGAVGSQEDQDQNAGTLRFTGTLTRFLVAGGSTEDIFALAEGATPVDFEFTIVGENLIETVTTTPYYDGIGFHMPNCVFGQPQKGERDGYKIETIPFTAYHDDTVGGPLEAFVYNDVADYLVAI